MQQPDVFKGKGAEFEKELGTLLNRLGIDSTLCIPDFILAKCMVNQLRATAEFQNDLDEHFS